MKVTRDWWKMFSIASRLSAVVLAFAVVGCGDSGTEEPEESNEGDAASAASESVVAAVQNGVGEATTEQIAAYPLDTCAVSGESLGSMGEAVDYFVDGKLVRLCCDHCIDQVKEEPEKILTKVAEASANAADVQ